MTSRLSPKAMQARASAFRRAAARQPQFKDQLESLAGDAEFAAKAATFGLAKQGLGPPEPEKPAANEAVEALQAQRARAGSA